MLRGAHAAPATFVPVSASTLFTSSGVRVGCLPRDQRAEPCDVRGCEAVPGRADDAAGRCWRRAATAADWRTYWRTSIEIPAKTCFRCGLENRYPSLGGSRVQIPPPPLKLETAHSYAVSSHCSSSLQTTVVANLGDDREDDWCQAGERARRPLDRRSENRMVAWRGRTRFPRRFFDRWTRSRPLAVLTSRRSPVLGTLPVAHYRALRASAVARKAPRACPRSRPRSARSHERLLGSGRPSGRSLRG